MKLIDKLSVLKEEPGCYFIFGKIMSYRYVCSAADVRAGVTQNVTLLEAGEHPNFALQQLYNQSLGHLDVAVVYAVDIEAACQYEYTLLNNPNIPQKLMNAPEVYDTSVWNL